MMTKTTLLFFLFFIQPIHALEIAEHDLGKQPSIYGLHSIGDLNGDGYNDIFASGILTVIDPSINCPAGPQPCYFIGVNEKAKVLINNQKGGFVEVEQDFDFRDFDVNIDYPVSSDVGIHDFYPAIADVDNDGDNDILSSDGRIFLNDGLAHFSQIGNTGIDILPSNQRPIFANDLDNDGVLEILASGLIYKRTSINPIHYEVFTSSLQWSLNLDVKVADFDNDGNTDILTYGEDNNIVLYFNDAMGTFSNGTLNYNVNEPLDLVVGDVNNDSYVDILLSSNKLIRNKPNHEFEIIENIIDFSPLGQSGEIVTYLPRKMVQHSNNEYLDLFITLDFYESVILINNGEGLFSIQLSDETSSLTFSGNGTSCFSGDFNADNKDDLILMRSDPIDNLGRQENVNNNPSEYLSLDDFKDIRVENEELILLTNKGLGFLVPSSFSTLNNSKKVLANIKGDETKEILTTSYEISRNGYFNQPSYIFDISSIDYKINTLESLLKGTNPHTFYVGSFDNYLPYDFNNNGLDDLLVSFSSQPTYIYFNSEGNYSIENRIKLDQELLINLQYVQVLDVNGDGLLDILNLNIAHQNLYINTGLNSFDKVLGEIPNFPQTINSGVAIINNDNIQDLYFIERYTYKPFVVYGNSDLSSLSIEYISDKQASAIYFADIDSNGYKDLFLIEKGTSNIFIYKNNNGSFNLFDSISFSDDIQNIEFFDFDFDGDLDFRVIEHNPTNINVYINYPNGFFSHANNYSFHQTDMTITNMHLIDLNNDSKWEVLVKYNSSINYNDKTLFVIYQLNQHGHYQAIYRDTDNIGIDYLFHDFDGDNYTDIVINHKILFGRDFAFLPGLNYDPIHNGHGFSIENVGSEQFFTVFYTYDYQGESQWYSDLGLFENNLGDYWNIGVTDTHLIRTLYDYDAQSFYQDEDTSQIGSISHSQCSDMYGELNLSYEIGLDFIGAVSEKGDWCSQPIADSKNRPKTNDMSGLWWAGNEDAGWGWSVELIETVESVEMVVILYYFDGSGQPRWLIGQQSGFEAGQEMTLDMNMVQGYGRSASPNNLAQIPAGTMSLTLNQASSNILSAGTLSIDVSYPGDEGGHWVRDNIPIALFSTAR